MEKETKKTKDSFNYDIVFSKNQKNKTYIDLYEGKDIKAKKTKARNTKDKEKVIEFLKSKLSNKKIIYISSCMEEILPYFGIYTTDCNSIRILSAQDEDLRNDYFKSFMEYVGKSRYSDFNDIFTSLVDTGKYRTFSIIETENEDCIDYSGDHIECLITKESLSNQKDLQLLSDFLDYLISIYSGSKSKCEIIAKDEKRNILGYDIILDNDSEIFTIHLKGQKLIRQMKNKLSDVEYGFLNSEIKRRVYKDEEFINGKNS